MTRRLGVVGLAVLGVVLAAGIALAAAHLVRQPIGLASEPVSAGRRLAPEPRSSKATAGVRARVRRRASDRARRQTRTIRSSPAGPSSPATSAPPPSGSSQGPATGSRDETSPGDDDGGGAGGSGGGEGDD